MLSFSEWGNGHALVFIHAFPLDSSMWQAQIEFFRERYRVITPDVPGFGASQPARSWTMREMGEQLAALLDRLGIKKCTLAGLSMAAISRFPLLSRIRLEWNAWYSHTLARGPTTRPSVQRETP